MKCVVESRIECARQKFKWIKDGKNETDFEFDSEAFPPYGEDWPIVPKMPFDIQLKFNRLVSKLTKKEEKIADQFIIRKKNVTKAEDITLILQADCAT